MALVIITLHDEGERVDIQLVTEPPIRRDEQMTEAQVLACAMLDAVATPDDVI